MVTWMNTPDGRLPRDEAAPHRAPWPQGCAGDPVGGGAGWVTGPVAVRRLCVSLRSVRHPPLSLTPHVTPNSGAHLFAAFDSPPARSVAVPATVVAGALPVVASSRETVLSALSPEKRQLHEKLRLNEVLVEVRSLPIDR